MKTTELTQICPYTGLRSFSEEESLYFKGRDLQVDQITSLLEKNKFLMVTGASGDGKSSLIYAGIIPNARAGFFKAKYTNWVVADFRPERNPVVNMARSLGEKFDAQPATLETELRRGFSSLIDLYTNSEFYTDEDDDTWKDLSEEEKKGKRRKAANLMIIVDQFEEFFTNPENFFNESPSQDSQIVVNLILETARIAIKRNLPVYVVCTMRSDYIGQCSVFRGLPEYIGFSQFFVPRLKRKDLKQVIEEPAVLSGNRISQRLIERLVFDIAEGVDQLPILQHALSQIWLSANQGNDEMDLIHYAMVGGMSKDELPDEDQAKFANWFQSLPETQQAYYQDTGLGMVIEIHASILYENAWSYYNQKHPQSPITQQEAKRIIALTFSCLTKIDNGRAVRNRMTLQEITAVINSPKFSADVVADVLNIYREEGNSFIRPFITDDGSSQRLHADSVLDITHESLIRNWNKLKKWANQEFEFFSTYLDFKKQLDRWKNSGKSSGYLLPIGPLTYFEEWFHQCKPNPAWIKRYSDIQEDQAQATKDAEVILADAREFLRRSARKVMVTRAFMKYGPQRIATVAAVIIMLVLSGFYWYDAEQKANEKVIQRVRQEAFDLIASPEVDEGVKSGYLLIEERYQPGSLMPYLTSREAKNRLSFSVEVYRNLMFEDKKYKGALKDDLIELISKDIKSPVGILPADLVTHGNKFISILLRDNYYNPDPKKAALAAEITGAIKNQVLKFYRDKKLFSPVIPFELNMALQLWFTAGSPTADQVLEITNAISPLANKEAESAFNTYYAKGSFEPNGRQPSDFNGGFHTLASCYAILGDFKGLEWCFNKQIENNQRSYFELGRIFNNHLNILGFLYQYKHTDLIPAYLKWIATNTADNPDYTIYRNLIIRAGYISDLYVGTNVGKFLRSYDGYLHPNLCLLDRDVFETIVSDYENILTKMPNAGEREFNLAMSNKRHAIYTHKYWYDRGISIDEKWVDGLLDKAMSHYANLSATDLEVKSATTTRYNFDGVRTKDLSRKELFIYPDYRDGWFSGTYHSDYFYNYLNKKGWLPKLYITAADLQIIHYWISRAYELGGNLVPLLLDNDYPLPDETLLSILSFVDHHPQGKAFDKNILILVLANHAFERGDSALGMKYYKEFDQTTIIGSSERYEYLDKNFFLNMMKNLCINLAALGKHDEAIELAEKFSQNHEKAFVYLYMADKVFQKNADPMTFVYLDSSYAKARLVDITALDPRLDFRINQIMLLSKIGSNRINKLATNTMRDIPGSDRFWGNFAQVWGIASEGNLYLASTSIPGTLTETEDLRCRTAILLEACRSKERIAGVNHWVAMDRLMDWEWYYVIYVPL